MRPFAIAMLLSTATMAHAEVESLGENHFTLSDTRNTKLRDTIRVEVVQAGYNCPFPTMLDFVQENHRGQIYQLHCISKDLKSWWDIRFIVNNGTHSYEAW